MHRFWTLHWGWASIALLVIILIKNYALRAAAATDNPVAIGPTVALLMLDAAFILCLAFKIVKKVKQSRLSRRTDAQNDQT